MAFLRCVRTVRSPSFGFCGLDTADSPFSIFGFRVGAALRPAIRSLILSLLALQHKNLSLGILTRVLPMWNGTPDQGRHNAIRASVGGSSFEVAYHRFLHSS